MFKRLIEGVLVLALACAPAVAANKTPLASYPGSPNQPIKAGDVIQASAPTTANASINLPHGTAPTSPANGDCWTTTAGLYCRVSGVTVGPYGTGGATGANPTATGSDAAVNGSASTYMRSDAAPAIQKGSSSQFGVIKVDGTTITESGGVISAAGGLRGGLFSWALSALPTTSSLALVNSSGGPTRSDTASGVYITSAGLSAVWTSSVPGTPYSITALIMPANPGSLPGLGWTDGTKLQFMYLNNSNGHINVQNNSAYNTYFSTSYDVFAAGYGTPLWFKIRDDGTTVYYMVSFDGLQFSTLYSVAKASGYLGSSGYSHIAVTAPGAIIVSWAQGT